MSVLKKAVDAFRNETFFKQGGYTVKAIPSEGDTLTYQLSIGEHTKFTIVWWVHPVSGMMSIEKYPVLESNLKYPQHIVDLLNEFYRSKTMFKLVQVGREEFQVHMLYGGKTKILDLTKPVDMAAEFEATDKSINR